MRIARNLDLIFLLLTLPIFIAAGWPILGWITGTGAWVAQRALRDFLAYRAKNSEDPRAIVGYMAGSLVGRGWLMAIIIFGVYLASGQDDAVGLGASVLFVAVFTLYFTVAMILRPFEEGKGL
jgi:hypothetical protein